MSDNDYVAAGWRIEFIDRQCRSERGAAAIDIVEALALALKHNLPLPQEMRKYIVQCLGEYLDGAGNVTLDAALQVESVGDGERSAAYIRALSKRNIALTVEMASLKQTLGISTEKAAAMVFARREAGGETKPSAKRLRDIYNDSAPHDETPFGRESAEIKAELLSAYPEHCRP